MSVLLFAGRLSAAPAQAAAPTLTSVSPDFGPAVGNKVITLTGTGFQSGASVFFDGLPATSVTVVSSSQITARTPAHSPATVSVEVRNPDLQSSTLPSSFTYRPAPVISSVTPNNGPIAGGTRVIILGQNFFSPIGAVWFDGKPGTTITWFDNTRIEVTTPAHAAATVNVQVFTDGQITTLAQAFTYSTTPTIQSFLPSSGSTAGGTAVSIAGTNFVSGATVLFDGLPATNVNVASSSQITALSPPHSSGSVSVQVTNPDSQFATLSNAFTYILVPTLTSVSPNFGPVAGNKLITLTGASFQSGASVFFDGLPATSVTVVSSSQITARTPAHAAATVNVEVRNPDLQSSTLPSSFTYRPAPVISSVTPNNGPIAGGTRVTILGQNFFSPIGAVWFDGKPGTTITWFDNTHIEVTTPAHAAAAVNVQVLTDGQVTTLAQGFTYGVSPSVQSISPVSGPTAGGTLVTISGANFQSGASVNFNGAAATNVTVVSPSQITAVTPPRAAGVVTVQVTNPDAQSAFLSNAFTYVAPPAVTSVNPNSGPIAGGTVITINGTGFQAGATVQLGSIAATNVTVVSSSQITATSPSHAAGAVAVQVTNPDLQSASLANAFTYIAPPTVTSVNPTSGPIAGGTPVTITGTGFQAGATVQVGGVAATNVTLVSSSQITATAPPHAAGAVIVQVTNPDNQSASLSNAFTYIAPPTVTSVNPTSGTTVGGTPVTITGTGFQAGATVQLGGVAATNVTVVNSSQITATTPAHAAGVVAVQVTNPDSQSASLPNAFTYVTPPSIASVSPSSGPTTGGTAVSISGLNFQSGASVRFNSIAAANVIVSSATQISAVTPAGASGTADVSVTNPDNQSATLPAGFTYAVSILLSSVSPDFGPAVGNKLITLTGASFQSGASVFFDGLPATSVTVVSSSQITARTPAHSPATVNVEVRNPDLQSSTLPSSFTYRPAPVISSVTPNNGPIAGGTRVTILGQNFFSPIGAVWFDGKPGTTITWFDNTHIEVTTPAHAAAAVNVQVLTDGQVTTLAQGFTYGVSPSVQSISPVSGPTAGGTLVTISGANFQSGASVNFNGAAATNVTVVSPSQITAVTPPRAAGVVTVQVTNPDAQSAFLSNAFTYVAPPAVTSVNPTSGPIAGGTPVTITGTGFQAGATVQLGSIAATNVTVVSSSQITATTPSHAVGAVSVQVTNPDAQSASLPGAFTYIAPPTVASVNPTGGPTAGGTAVTIVGTGFQIGATVRFGGILASNVSVDSASQITATSPPRTAGVVTVRVTNPDAQFATLPSAFAYIAPPTVSSVNPPSGPTAGGTLVTIAGTSFHSDATVEFGDTASSDVTVVNSSQITAIVPPHAAGIVAVRVTNPDAQSASLLNAFTYVPPPSVTSVSPSSGSTAGGTAVTISGSNFQSGASVRFNGIAATNVIVASAVQISAFTPPGASGAADVSVTNPDSQSATLPVGFFYTGSTSLSLTLVSPNVGPVAGNKLITLTGTNFQAGASVFFDGLPATSVTVVSPTQITARTPAHSPATVSVEVRNPDLQSFTLPTSFTYRPAPIISNLSPNSGPITGGTRVTILGQNFFSPIGAVWFDGKPGTSITWFDNTRIEVTTPSHAAATVNVQVLTDGQVTTLAAGFAYGPPPTIGSISPATGPTVGGTVVIITGTNFQQDADVFFGGIQGASTVILSSTQIRTTTPAHTAGPANVSVVNTDSQTAILTNGFSYFSTFLVTAISPATGPPAGGTRVRIFGTDFQSGATVDFSGVPATDVLFVNSSEIQATTPGIGLGPANVNVHNPGGAVASLPSGFNVAFSNEPSGFTRLTERPFSAIDEANWEIAPDSLFTIVSDPLAPQSAPFVGQATFPAGWEGGGEPMRIHKQFANAGDQLYLSFWIQFSPNWQGNPSSVNKVVYLWIGGKPMLFFTAVGVDNDPLMPEIWLQDLQADPIDDARNLGGNLNDTKQITRGVWHKVEILVDSNTPGQTNGHVRWWVDAVPIGDYSNIGFVDSLHPNDWQTVQWAPVWGGAEGIVEQEMYQRMDHLVVSALAPVVGAPSPDANDLIVFQDGFESGDLSNWDNVDTSRYFVESSAGRVRSGTRSLRGLVSQTSWFGELDKWYMPGQEEIYAKFYVLFEDNFVTPGYGMHFAIMMGNRVDDMWSASGQAGIKPNGSDFFISFLDPEPPNFYEDDSGLYPFTLYSYWPDMACPSGNPCFGNYINQTAPKSTTHTGVWHEVVFHIKLNTPGQNNGSQAMWMDGVKKIEHLNIRWRDTLDLKLNQFAFALYIEGGATKTEFLWIDDLVIWSPR